MKHLKQAAARSACGLVKDGHILGLGTGSTVAHLIDELSRRIYEEGLEIACIPTSRGTELLARGKGIPLTSFDEHTEMDLAIDGADQVAKSLDMIKGGGAAHTREKIVASHSRRFVVIVDEGKLSESLSVQVPVEVLPFSWRPAADGLSKLGGSAVLRQGSGKAGPVITDNGNYVLDTDFGVIRNPRKLEAEINLIKGVIENGIFPDMAPEVHVGTEDGVKVLRKS